jgi:hypothetical protein
MMQEAQRMVQRRPRYCETVGMKGTDMRAPKEYMALRRPRVDEEGWSKSEKSYF